MQDSSHKMKKIFLTLTLFTCVAGFSQVTKLVLKKGQKFEVTTVNKVISESDVMGQTMESNIENTIVETYEVKDVSGNAIELQKTITKLKANMQVMGQDMNYDSDDKNATGQMAEAFSGLVGKEKNLQIDGNGNITREAEKDEAEISLMESVGAMGQQTGLTLLNPALLNQNLVVGSSWTDSSLIVVDQLKTKVNGIYTLLSKQGNSATFQYEGKQLVEGNMEQMGQSMAMKGTNEVKMTIILNIDNGVISEVSNTIDGKTNIEAMGMTIPATIKSTITTTVKAL